jgi:hypothetical protein
MPIELIILLLAMCFCAAIQSDIKRRLAALCFSCTVAMHEVVFMECAGFLYYGTDAVLNIMVMLIIRHSGILNSLGHKINNVCIASICINFLGILMYYSGMEHVLYNWMFNLLYFYVVIMLLNEEFNVDDNLLSLYRISPVFNNRFRNKGGV